MTGGINTYTTTLPTMHYSDQGKAAASAYHEVAQSLTSPGAISDTYSKGFREILSNPMTTPDEKMLAQIGFDLGSYRMEKSLIAQAQTGFMSALAQPVSAPVNSVIYRASLEAIKDIESDDAGRILWYSFRAMDQKPGASLQERTLAELGMEMHSLVTGDPALMSMTKLLNTLTRPFSRPIGCTVATATLDFINCISPSYRGNLLWKSLDLIENSPGSTPYEKALAKFGFNITRNYLEGDSSMKARTKILEALATPEEIKNARAIARAACMIAGEGLPEEDLKTIFSHGFMMIGDDPTSTDEEKKLADKGLKYCYRDTKGTKVMCSIMEQILAASMDISTEEILLGKSQGGGNPSSSIEVGDEYVDIDGVKLEVHDPRLLKCILYRQHPLLTRS